MTDIVDLNSKRPPVVYTVTIVHHYDGTLEFRVDDVADDPRSREAVMSAFRRISGADEEIEKLRTDLRHAINCDNEYVKEMDRQNAALREENARLHQAMHDIYEVYAGSEGFKPETCAEAYLQERILEMAYIAGKHKRVGGGND